MLRRAGKAFRISNLLFVGFVAVVVIFLLHLTNVSMILEPIKVAKDKMHLKNVGSKSQTQELKDRASELLKNLGEDRMALTELMNKAIPVGNVGESITTTRDPVAEESSRTQQISAHDHTPLLNERNLKPSNSLIGLAKHPILSLSDTEFRAKSFDVMMGWYGEADGGGSCGIDFGNALINRWRDTKESYCDPKDLGPAGSRVADGSSIDCYLVHQTRHHGGGDNLCVMKNVSVNMGFFGDKSSIDRVVEEYVNTKHNQQPYVDFPMGFLKSPCTTVSSKWKSQSMPGWNEQWTTGSFQSVSAPLNLDVGDVGLRGAGDGLCDEWVNHRVLIVQRDTFANFFHDSEDFTNAFIALAVLRWSMDDTQVYLTDLYPKGPFWDIWSRPFSGKFSTLDAWDLKQAFGVRGTGKNVKGTAHRVCYKELAVGIYGPASPVTVNSWDTPCSATALVKAYSDFIIRGLNLQAFTHYSQPQPSRTIVVTFLARRASSEWPEKRFCDNAKSFFRCELWADWGIRSLGRMVRNDAEVVTTLKELETTTFKSGAKVKFQDVDFNLLSFEEQIKVDLETDVLVGPHGAGLMHNIFMRDRAVLVELSVDGSAGLRHFSNLAHWYGRSYHGLTPSNPIDAVLLKEELRHIIEEIPLDSY